MSDRLRFLIDAAAPLWAGEAEVFQVYWDWSQRSRETDRRWLAYQCGKEVWGSGIGHQSGLLLGPAQELLEVFPQLDNDVDRHEVLELAETLYAEFAHYCAFADAHDALAVPGEPKINPHILINSWPEDKELTSLRFEHRRDYPRLGIRATYFTEGGYCTLFSEGMKLAERTTGPHGRANALIAAACQRVYEDEFTHMLKGIAGLDSEELTDAEWETLTELSVTQLRLRIRMRNSQFSYPLTEDRVREIYDGACSPIPFDYAKAGL